MLQANIGTSSAAIPLNSEEACAEGSDEQPEVMRDVLPTSTKNDDTTATSDLAVEAGSSQVGFCFFHKKVTYDGLPWGGNIS